ncbi:MAG: NADH-quinone oxidoreductase subunit A [Candidatus Methanomethylicia archaeon]
MWLEIFLSPIMVFILILILNYISYRLLKRIGLPPRRSELSLEPYACGEGVDRFPPEKVQLNVQLYKYALYFTIFDVMAFILLISSGANLLLVSIYAIIVVSAVLSLPKR